MHSSGESGEAKRTSDFLVWGFSFHRAFYRSEGLTDIVFFVACYIVSQSYPVLFQRRVRFFDRCMSRAIFLQFVPQGITLLSGSIVAFIFVLLMYWFFYISALCLVFVGSHPAIRPWRQGSLRGFPEAKKIHTVIS